MHFLSSRKRTDEQELEAGAKRLRTEGGRGLGWRRAGDENKRRHSGRAIRIHPRQASRLLSRDKKESEEANGNADGTATPPRQATALQAAGDKRRGGWAIRARRSKPRRYKRWGSGARWRKVGGRAIRIPPRQASGLLVGVVAVGADFFGGVGIFCYFCSCF